MLAKHGLACTSMSNTLHPIRMLVLIANQDRRDFAAVLGVLPYVLKLTLKQILLKLQL